MATTTTELISAERIAARVAELGAEISERYAGKDIVLAIVLKGSYVFGADLARAIDERVGVEIDFIAVRSYGDSTESSGVVQLTTDLSRSIEGKHVILVEDIVDTGLTMQYLIENLSTRDPATLELASLLHKPARARTKIEIDYLGFTIEDTFVVGYGLDYAQRMRNLPYIAEVHLDGEGA